MASTLIETLYSQNHWIADGSQTVWDFTFAGNSSSLTYLDRSHVKAYWIDTSGSRHDITIIDPTDWLGDYQIQTIPAPPAGMEFVIYRDTPKDKPIVDWADGAAQSEVSLDDMSKQSVFIAAEILDNSGLFPDLGFKALKHILYTGASTVADLDNGRAHYKEDGTQVTLPNTTPTEYLTTIINNGDTPMTVVCTSCVAHRQGIADTAGVSSFTIPARNTVGATKMSSGHWFVNGYITA